MHTREFKPDEDVQMFVYGTLRTGWGNNRLFQNEHCEFVGAGRTKEVFTLRASGIPFVNRDDPRHQVVGEVWSVKGRWVPQVDQLESHPRWYKRELTTIILDEGREVEAWLYFNPESHSPIVESGDFADTSRIRECC